MKHATMPSCLACSVTQASGDFVSASCSLGLHSLEAYGSLVSCTKGHCRNLSALCDHHWSYPFLSDLPSAGKAVVQCNLFSHFHCHSFSLDRAKPHERAIRDNLRQCGAESRTGCSMSTAGQGCL